ncbi:sigma-E factor negative regulatory protein [Marinicella sp. W31]|uniref:sigma-E factor negative regulatory protein n=1 Tax=Marinicella sp. W31 TaxID=3023713 RepID=UPI003757C60A
MSDKSNQNISELMDGEFDAHSSRFLLKRMLADESLSRTWSSYHLLRNYLQKEADSPLQNNMGQQVCQMLGKENMPEQETITENSRGWVKPLLGSAIAASVAFMAVFTFQTLNQPGNNLDVDAASQLIVENVRTADQLITPPAASVARSEDRNFSRYPSLTPQVGHYLDNKNVQSIDQYPFYYNQEYLRQLENQIKQTNQQQQTAE